MASPTQFRLTPKGAVVYYDDGTRSFAKKSIGGMYLMTGPRGEVPDPPDDGGGDVNPSDITITNCRGESLNISGNRKKWAVGIYKGAQKLKLSKAQRRRAGIAGLMTALVESVLLMYANSNVPESLNYPHDAVGSDHDSCGLMQQRPSSGWGTVAQLMDAEYNSRAFYGGPTGPNNGSPPGLLDKSGWTTGDLGAWCQAVQVSAHPERYACWQSGATKLYDHIAASGTSGKGWVWPYKLSEVTSEFRPPGRPTHDGIDFSGPKSSATGADIPAAAAGRVRSILRASDGWHGWGNGVTITHADGSYTLYAHMYQVPKLSVGQRIAVRQRVGGIGNTGNSFGNHLHFECHPSGGGAVDPRDFMAGRNATEPS